MAVKRRRKMTKRTATSSASGQAMPAEGASALNFLGLGDTLGTMFGRRRKAPAKRRATKKTRAKVKTTRAKTKSPVRKARRRKTTRRARA